VFRLVLDLLRLARSTYIKVYYTSLRLVLQRRVTEQPSVDGNVMTSIKSSRASGGTTLSDSQKGLEGSGNAIPFGDFNAVEICGHAGGLIQSLIGR
jgi:hypothetical protein